MAAGKYTPFQKYLEGIPSSRRNITIPFDQIERIIRAQLPKSAGTYQEWWSNESTGSHVQSHAWMNAGWRVDSVDLSAKWVRFFRF
jgi:hypothetical protein